MERFVKIVKWLLAVNYFHQTLRLRCLTGFWIHLWELVPSLWNLVPKKVKQSEILNILKLNQNVTPRRMSMHNMQNISCLSHWNLCLDKYSSFKWRKIEICYYYHIFIIYFNNFILEFNCFVYRARPNILLYGSPALLFQKVKLKYYSSKIFFLWLF